MEHRTSQDTGEMVSLPYHQLVLAQARHLHQDLTRGLPIIESERQAVRSGQRCGSSCTPHDHFVSQLGSIRPNHCDHPTGPDGAPQARYRGESSLGGGRGTQRDTPISRDHGSASNSGAEPNCQIPTFFSYLHLLSHNNKPKYLG